LVFVFNNNTEMKLIQKFKKKISELYIKILYAKHVIISQTIMW